MHRDSKNLLQKQQLPHTPVEQGAQTWHNCSGRKGKINEHSLRAEKPRGIQTMLPSESTTWTNLPSTTLHLHARIFSVLFPSPHCMQLQELFIHQKKPSWLYFFPSLLNPQSEITIWCPDINLMLATIMPQGHGIILITITTLTLGFSQPR